jgi:hypothetical protein
MLGAFLSGMALGAFALAVVFLLAINVRSNRGGNA